MSKVEIGHSTLVVDGTDIASAVTSYTVHRDAGAYDRLTTVVVDIIAEHFAFEGEATIGVSQRVHDALVAIGWTPPPSP